MLSQCFNYDMCGFFVMSVDAYIRKIIFIELCGWMQLCFDSKEIAKMPDQLSLLIPQSLYNKTFYNCN